MSWSELRRKSTEGTGCSLVETVVEEERGLLDVLSRADGILRHQCTNQKSQTDSDEGGSSIYAVSETRLNWFG
jgi:hypothetical protein